MRPTNTPDCNFTYKGPTPDVGDLRVQRVKEPREDGQGEDNVVNSFWPPDENERALLTAGGTLQVGVWNMEPIPPLSLNVVTPYCTRGCEVTCDLVDDPRPQFAGKQVFACPTCAETANGTGRLPEQEGERVIPADEVEEIRPTEEPGSSA